MTLEFHGLLEPFTKVMRKKEFEEISQKDEDRNQVIDKYGLGDIGRGEGEE